MLFLLRLSSKPAYSDVTMHALYFFRGGKVKHSDESVLPVSKKGIDDCAFSTLWHLRYGTYVILPNLLYIANVESALFNVPQKKKGRERENGPLALWWKMDVQTCVCLELNPEPTIPAQGCGKLLFNYMGNSCPGSFHHPQTSRTRY